jgi:hypothetical protein
MGRLEWAAFLAVAALAVLVRAVGLDRGGNWVDESESCINALTILDEGLPRDTYLGLPIYENVLVEEWPESAEYEFRDSSYSRRGLAVYHGWLPLYAIAASFACFGIEPDRVGARPPTRGSLQDMDRRTSAGRMPSVLFGALFVITLFAAARELFGREAAWAALLIGGFAAPLVRYGREARYYSATLLFATLAIWLLWRLCERGRKRDGVLAGLAFGALFHTHALSFVVAAVMSALAFVVAGRRRTHVASFVVFGAVVTAAVAPFVLWSGFLEQAGAVPKAWPLLAWPDDYLLFPREKLPYLLFVGAGLVAMLAARSARGDGRLAALWSRPLRPALGLALWLAVGYACFLFVTPAASFFVARATIVLAAPAVLLCAASVGTAASSLPPGRATRTILVAAATIACLAGTWRAPWNARKSLTHAQAAVVELAEHGDVRADTRFYATPNEHLNLTFYSGLPFQSIAPVRRAFLDAHAGPIVFIDSTVSEEPIAIDEIVRLAAARGRNLDLDEARELRERGATLAEPLPELDDLDRAVLERQHELAPTRVLRLRPPLEDNPAIFRGHQLADWSEWWPIFFWRFVDPRSRMGPNANIAGRLHGARATVLPSSWTLYRCEALAAPH